MNQEFDKCLPLTNYSINGRFDPLTEFYGNKYLTPILGHNKRKYDNKVVISFI